MTKQHESILPNREKNFPKNGFAFLPNADFANLSNSTNAEIWTC